MTRNEQTLRLRQIALITIHFHFDKGFFLQQAKATEYMVNRMLSFYAVSPQTVVREQYEEYRQNRIIQKIEQNRSSENFIIFRINYVKTNKNFTHVELRITFKKNFNLIILVCTDNLKLLFIFFYDFNHCQRRTTNEIFYIIILICLDIIKKTKNIKPQALF